MSRLNLGCGKDIKKGFINIDLCKSEGVNVVHDLDKFPYPFKDNSAEVILAFHILEHVDNYKKTMEEIYRILKIGGRLYIKVPHWTAAGAFSEFHRRFFWWNSFTSKRLFYETSLETEIYSRFKTKRKRLKFNKWPLFWNFLIEPLINIKYVPQIYEHTFLHSLFPAKEITVVMEKIK